MGYTGEVHDITPTFPGLDVRGLEIQAWIDAQTVKPRAFAILDDFEPMQHLAHRLVRTDYDDGLTDEKVDEVVRLITSQL